jgi:tRNA threonylcarbamoyladenosine biosynthesis protein TsaB
MALATKQHQNAQFLKQDYYLCPMIDARRMEVFTGLFNSDLLEVVNSFALELSPDSFSDYLETHEIFFSGSGSIKFQQVSRHEHATFLQVDHSAIHLAELSSVKFSNGNFSDVAYTEPLYLKEFYTTSKK